MNRLDDIKRPVADDFALYERAFRMALTSENPLLQQVLDYVHGRRGKQLRPVLVLLAAKMSHGVSDKTIRTAVALELLHTATLVHDDVVDNSPTRRGAPSVHAQWNNKVAVLVGDYMLAKVIDLTASLRNLKILSIVAEMGQTLSSGELLQLHSNESMWIDEATYYKVIAQKTAALFAACMQAGAASAGATQKQETALRTFGHELGLIFQIKDDVLDYSDQEIGKPTLSDIRDGKATLPLICALSRAPRQEADEIRAMAERLPSMSNDSEAVQTIQSFVLRYDGVGYAARQMELHKQRAVEALSMFHDSETKAALLQILQYTIIRNH